MSKVESKEIPLLVVSCDKYSDLWTPFFKVFKTRWPDCPYPLYLGSNHLLCMEDDVSTIQIGDDVSWTSGLIKMLNRLPHTFVILFLEDFFLTKHVQTSEINRLVAIAQAESLDCLRFSPLPPPTPLPTNLILGYEDLGVVESNSPYSIATQPAIWRKDFLLELLVPGFSAWEFEHTASTMCEFMNVKIWGPMIPYMNYEQVVEKGKWKAAGLAICKSCDALADFTARPIFSDYELEAHFKSGLAESVVHEKKMAAIRAFQVNKRISGIKNIAAYLYAKPISFQGWIILISGVMGSRFLIMVRKFHLSQKIALAKKRVVSE